MTYWWSSQVKVMRCLHHPNVLKFIGLFYKDKRIHFVSEYIQGGTLREAITKMVSSNDHWDMGGIGVCRHNVLVIIF